MSSSDNKFHGVYDANALTVIICSALALYNSLELVLLVFTTFTAYRGLYFWSLVLASFGIVPYVLGFSIEYFCLSYLALGIAIDTVGWILMVTGQSVVLYSRLWLVFGGSYPRLLKAVKWVIICDGLLFHGMTTIVVYGSHFSTHASNFGVAYDYIERIQMVGFCIQESIISGLYIWKALDIIRVSETKRSQRLSWQLMAMNIIVIILDIGLLTIEFLNFHVLQQTFKGFAYSIKLKLELVVLNKLVELSGSSHHRVTAITVGDTNDFLDPTKTVWDITRFTPAFSQNMHKPPKWLSDLEESGIQRIESAYSPTDSAWVRTKRSSTIISDDYLPDGVQPVSTPADPRLDAREKGSATDLLYADAVRTMANPG
ncbi:hypothetical protein K504DRAFT_378434 [Pleomassaria siparia CBS 279.74]|uniref:DUF7703 domain-containing protein n=1 Tax=Pleomassaria siparia CBS 279.74 TaxID=1314801 RepID=A0A6G1KAW0_9PLEO|nr:hypothetical protein K504DRAFT_378434 [Pleomassaria siparia CBS 279.74]